MTQSPSPQLCLLAPMAPMVPGAAAAATPRIWMHQMAPTHISATNDTVSRPSAMPPIPHGSHSTGGCSRSHTTHLDAPNGADPYLSHQRHSLLALSYASRPPWLPWHRGPQPQLHYTLGCAEWRQPISQPPTTQSPGPQLCLPAPIHMSPGPAMSTSLTDTY